MPTILLVEDSDSSRLEVKSLLQSEMEVEIIEAVDGLDGLERFKLNEFDLDEINHVYLNEKQAFPMTYFQKNHTLITVGGFSGIQYLKEVSEYSLKRNVWRALPRFPFRLS